MSVPVKEEQEIMKKASMTKYLSLVVLVIQNTALVLTLRYSRVSTTEGEPLYIVSTAVVMTELTKFIISITAYLHTNEYNISKTLNSLYDEILDKLNDTLKLSVPAILYTIQNNLLFIALSNLDAATFQVCLCVCECFKVCVCVYCAGDISA